MKKILIICNDLGECIFKKCIEHISVSYELEILRRPNWYLTDLRSAKYSIFRAINKIINYKKEISFVDERLKKLRGQYDYIFCIGYYQMSSKIIKKIKEWSPNCKTIIYFYDSFCRLDFSNDIKLFDISYTFDMDDAKRFKIRYLPFFASKYSDKQTIEYDMCHVGSWSPGHLYRVPVLQSIKNNFPTKKSFFYCTYLNPYKLPLFRKVKFILVSLFNKEYYLYLQFFKHYCTSQILTQKRMAYEDMLNIEAKSKIIVEINAQRAGLSPRVINALANHRKVIINNPKIKNEIFYDSENIYIIDEKSHRINSSFFTDKHTSLSFDFSDLFIENWIEIILNNKANKFDKYK